MRWITVERILSATFFVFYLYRIKVFGLAWLDLQLASHASVSLAPSFLPAMQRLTRGTMAVLLNVLFNACLLKHFRLQPIVQRP